MSITRRSLLHSLAALPVIHSLDSLSLIQAASDGRKAKDTPSANSVFVLFTGPWLIFQSSGNVLTALTIGSTSKMHRCVLEGWSSATGASVGTLLQDVTPGTPLRLSPAGFSQPDDFVNAFSQPFGYDPIAWIDTSTAQISTPAITVLPVDRSVVLDLPTKIYTGGFLLGATVKETKSGVLHQKNGASHVSSVNPHVITILEYAPDDGKSVSLSVPGVANPSVPGDHLIFRLQHQGDCDDELGHIRCAFDYLTAHINTSYPLVTLAVSNTKYGKGDHVDGISEQEMGLCTVACTRQSKDNTYANCAGNSLIVGP